MVSLQLKPNEGWIYSDDIWWYSGEKLPLEKRRDIPWLGSV